MIRYKIRLAREKHNNPAAQLASDETEDLVDGGPYSNENEELCTLAGARGQVGAGSGIGQVWHCGALQFNAQLTVESIGSKDQ